jgi:hypothetical protein
LEGVVVELPDGRVPVLVRDFGHTLSICVAEVEVCRSGRVSATTLREAITAARSWIEASSPERVTLYELVLHLAGLLADALGQRWAVFFSGMPGAPNEARLDGPEFHAASVRVFGDRVLVPIHYGREFAIGSRRDFAACDAAIVAAVREQLAAYEANVALSQRVRACADDLAARLGERMGIACRAEGRLYPTYERASEARILVDSRELVQVFVKGEDVVWLHAGLPGHDGWEGSGDQAELEAIVAAIEREAETLMIEGLIPGHRYRVIQDLGELRAGMIVRFVGIDDIDNHYGIGEFTGPDGERLGVPGDYSTRRSSPLGPAYRYLVELEAD